MKIEIQATRENILTKVKERLGLMTPYRLYNVNIEAYRKPRTTGPRSQCNHINGHVQQISEESGHDFSEIKWLAKMRAIKRGYPYDTVLGDVVPWSEARLNTDQAAHLIDELHAIADELGLILREQ